MKRRLIVLFTIVVIWLSSCSNVKQQSGQPQPNVDTTQIDTTQIDTSAVDSF